MTPEDRAKAIIARYSNDYEDWSDEEAFVADHIRAAVAEEREACAKIADERARGDRLVAQSPVVQYHSTTTTAKELMECVANEAERIAALIRARGDNRGDNGPEGPRT